LSDDQSSVGLHRQYLPFTDGTNGVASEAARSRTRSQVQIESAGTHAHANGKSPDARIIGVRSKRNYQLCRTKARKVMPQDFQTFDLILAMDAGFHAVAMSSIFIRMEMTAALSQCSRLKTRRQTWGVA